MSLLPNEVDKMCKEMEKDELKEIIHHLSEMIINAVRIAELSMAGGEKHKQWVIDQIVRTLLEDKYATWKADLEKYVAKVTPIIWSSGAYANIDEKYQWKEK